MARYVCLLLAMVTAVFADALAAPRAGIDQNKLATAERGAPEEGRRYANLAPPGGFGSHLVTGIEIALDGQVLGGDAAFLGESTLCSPENVGALSAWLRNKLLTELNPKIKKAAKVGIRDDAQLLLNCAFRAEVARACQNEIVLRLVMPKNLLRFWVDVPSRYDPGFRVTIDFAATTKVVIPANSHGAIAVATTTLSVSNLKVEGDNPLGDAITWMAKATNDIHVFFGGRDFRAILEQTHQLKFPGVSKTLVGLHPVFKRIPPAYRIQACMRGDSNVMRLNAGTEEPVARGMENHTDRPGLDYHGFDAVSPAACQNACLADRDRCAAWTYVRPGVQGESARCYMKNAVPPPVPNLCCVSGVMPSKTGPDAMREPGPLVPVPPRGPGDVTRLPDDGLANMPVSAGCKPPFVQRRARPADAVCVSRESHALVLDENATASSRWYPNGPYGPNTCIPGYVWREAFDGDVVCVSPERRAEVKEENRSAPTRRAWSPRPQY
jgi:PAN domain